MANRSQTAYAVRFVVQRLKEVAPKHPIHHPHPQDGRTLPNKLPHSNCHYWNFEEYFAHFLQNESFNSLAISSRLCWQRAKTRRSRFPVSALLLAG
jgi:hypothetical protein